MQFQGWILQGARDLTPPNDGPMARTTTLAWPEASAEMMRPPIRTLSSVPTCPRVLMLANWVAAAGIEIVGLDQRGAGAAVLPLTIAV